MNKPLLIQRERPDRAEVMALLATLDSRLAGPYPPEAKHILSVRELLAPRYALRKPFCGYADNGLSVCFSKVL